MAPSKQNLFLFLEETESKTVISRKLVLIYANRCVIDEDAQFEISDVYELEYVSNSMLNFTDPLYELNAGRRDLKEFREIRFWKHLERHICTNLTQLTHILLLEVHII